MKSVIERFNRAADHCYKIASDRFSLSLAFAAGVAVLPFSAQVGAAILAAPAVYAGFGLTQRGIAKGLELLSSRAP